MSGGHVSCPRRSGAFSYPMIAFMPDNAASPGANGDDPRLTPWLSACYLWNMWYLLTVKNIIK